MELGTVYSSKLDFLDDRSVVPYMFAHLTTISDEIFSEIKDSLSRERKILTSNKDIRRSDKSLVLGFYVNFKYKLSAHLIETFEARVDWVRKLSTKRRKRLKANFLEQLVQIEKASSKNDETREAEFAGVFRKKGLVMGTPPIENMFHFDSLGKSIVAILKQNNWGHTRGPFVYI